MGENESMDISKFILFLELSFKKYAKHKDPGKNVDITVCLGLWGTWEGIPINVTPGIRGSWYGLCFIP